MPRTTRLADDVLGTLPTGGRSGGADAVTLLSILVVVRLALPSQFVVGPIGGGGAPATLLGLMLLAYWLWHRLRRTAPEKGPAVNGVALFFVTVALASYVVALWRPILADELSLSGLSLLILASWLGGLLLASDGVTTWDRFRVLVNRLVVMGGVFAGFGLVQFVTKTAWVDKLSIPGLSINTPIYSVTQRDGFTRPFSTAIHPIEFGSVIAMLLPLTVVYGLLGAGRRRPRWLYWIPAALTVLAASLSSSRSTVLGVIIGAVLLWPALTRVQRIVGGIAAVVLGAFVFVFVPGMVGTIAGLFGGVTSGDASVASRVDSFAVAASYFVRTPILGRGFGTFLPRYRIFDNQYLLGLVETGALGFVALLLLWVVPVIGIARVLRGTGLGSPERLLGGGLLAACVVGGVGLAFFDGFGFPMMPAIWFILLGLSAAYIRLAATSSS
jgi:O-antigen ligase